MQQPRINIKWYIFADILICIFTWVCFYYLRTVIYKYPFSIPPGFYLGLTLYTIGYLSLHFLSGTYNSLYQKSRFAEITKSIIVVLIGCIVLLFFFVLKNPHTNNNNYYLEFYSLLLPMLFSTVVMRMLFLTVVKKQLTDKKVFFNSLLIGSGQKAEEFYDAFTKNSEQGGYRITGFYNTNGKEAMFLAPDVKKFDKQYNISKIIKDERIEEVIIAVEKNERELLTSILQNLSNQEINIKITPDTVDIISGALQTNNILGVPLIDIHSGLLPSWQQNIKRAFDITMSFLALIGLSPLLLYTLIRVSLSSKGTLFFVQERIGYKGRPFNMYKFRSMYMNAEADGPQLSSDHDTRITTWGRIMRKWRLDELPQLWNILKGEMSFVGPRPERQYYIERIIALHPEYKYIFKVKPGLTSWGMVKFGYASTIDEMIKRMPYDLLYVENVSLGLDFKIMLHSIQIILAGKGK